MSAGGLDTVGSPAFTDEDSARFRAAGWWSDATLSDAVRSNAENSPEQPAYVDHPGVSLNWREFDRIASSLAERLAGIGVVRGDRVAVWHRDSAAIHVLFVAIERCGAVVVGIGARAGTREVAAILRSSRPKILIRDQERSGAAAVVADECPVSTLVLGGDAGAPQLEVDAEAKALGVDSRLGPDDVFLINSTSGTTGLPKCVVHTQNRWHYFHQKAVANGLLTSDDIFLPVIPMPFGFGIWTSHTTPIYLG
ncbi:MAG TPA: class I adenylate-forming enzyme family protein, partial [Mycobacterium sp.]|nr:class I adenylate-forming enzyme family protein [Mycobacterium sp.]